MASAVTPIFLKGARRVDLSDQSHQKETPSFLKGSKRISSPSAPQKFPTDAEDEKEYERSLAQLTSRGIETAVGAPGDIASFVTGLFGGEQKILPTSQDLRKFSEEKSLGYTKPKTEFEEQTGQLFSDAVSMAMPGAKNYSFARNIGIPAIGSLVKEGIKYMSGDDKDQAYGKVGAMIALDLLSNRSGGARKFAGSLFQKAEDSLPKGVSVKATDLERSLDTLEKSLSAGGSRATTKKALEKVAEIKNEIKNGKIDVKRLAAYRPSINETIEELGGFNLELPKKLKPSAIRNLNQVKSEVIKTLTQYGEKFNPEFLKNHQSANEAWAAYENSNKIANFLKDKVPYAPKSKAAMTLFSYAPVSAAGSMLAMSPAAGAATLGGIGAYQGYKVLDRIMRSPTLRKFYLNTLKEAAAGNVATTSKNLKALDNLLALQQDPIQSEK